MSVGDRGGEELLLRFVTGVSRCVQRGSQRVKIWMMKKMNNVAEGVGVVWL